MRTFGTFLVAVIFAGVAGCGSSSSTGTDSSTPGPGLDAGTGPDIVHSGPDVSLGGPDVSLGSPDVSTGIDMGPSGTGIDGGFTSPTGRTPATVGMCPGSTSGQTCTGEQEYSDCLTAACGTQIKACFGNNSMQGDYTGGLCQQFITCEMACPCDATGTNCVVSCAAQYMYTMPDCVSCIPTLTACIEAAGCVEPVCTTIDAGIPTNTSIDAGVPTGANCTAAQACCESLPVALSSTCQSSLVNAGGVEATCAAIVAGFQTAGYCSTTATATTTSTTTSTTTATTTSTTTASTTSTTTATSTATSASCTAARACCTSLPPTLISTCQTSLAGAGGVEATCAAIVAGFQSAGYCK